MTVDLATRPGPSEHADYQTPYIAAVPDGDIRETLAAAGESAQRLYAAISEPRSHFAYSPGKWTIREVVAHVADSERVFAYRALRFGRADSTPLPGFDQEIWVPHSRASTRPWEEIIADFAAVRAATLSLVRSFSGEDWERGGKASGIAVTVRALTWVIAGHELHHRRILLERYGVGVA
ncbi:MAG: DinB family protein [Thermoanaerobaculia bacterium]